MPQRIYGLEFVGNVRPLQWLSLGTVLGYMDGRQDLKNEGSYKDNLFNADYYPVHAEVRGATNEGRYYIKGTGTMANLGIQFDL